MRPLKYLVILGLITLLGWSHSAHANMGDMRFKVMQDCHENACDLVALGVGSITKQTPASLSAFRSRYPNIKTYFFHSPGGDVQAGLEIGQELRKQGLDTTLTSKMRCLSACAYAFLGGNRREVRRGGIVGVHRFRSYGGKSDEQVAQVLVTLLTQYVEGMGVSNQLISVASMAGTNEMIGIDWEDARDLRVDNTVSEDAQWTLNYIEDQLAVAAQEIDEGSDRQITILAGDIGSAIVVMGSIKYPYFHPYPPQSPYRVQVCIYDRCLISDQVVHKNWKEKERFRATVWKLDRTEFLDILGSAQFDASAQIVFSIVSDTEQTVVGGPVKPFSALFERTGPSENYLRVSP